MIAPNEYLYSILLKLQVLPLRQTVWPLSGSERWLNRLHIRVCDRSIPRELLRYRYRHLIEHAAAGWFVGLVLFAIA